MIFLIMTLVVGITSFARLNFGNFHGKRLLRLQNRRVRWCLLISMRIGAGLAR